MATINIVCDEADSGWIYSKFIKEFVNHSCNKILVNAKTNFDIAHYLPYYNAPGTPHLLSTAWISHQEVREPLKTKFISVAKSVNMAISHSKKYMDLLLSNDIIKTTQIMPGIDFDIFKQRSANRPGRNKLVVGYIGRQYASSNRKNQNLLSKISKLPFVEMRATNGKIPQNKMPHFYADLDIVCQTSIVEGGSMAITEGLAVGIPIICYDSVGVANEFDTGVIRVEFNNESMFISKLNEFWTNKMFLQYNDKQLMDKMYEQVKDFSWKNFVKKHDDVWRSICE